MSTGFLVYIEVEQEKRTFVVMFRVLVLLTHSELTPDEDGGGVWVVVEVALLRGATGGGRLICAVAVPSAYPAIW